MKKKVALVLSSGGARGIAHIGVIEVLEENGYEISSIAGTSMGALIGGFHAAGQLKDYSDWLITLDRMDVFSLVDFSISSSGLVKGKRIIEKMKEIIPDRMIEDLQIPYCAVATDILSGKEKVLNSGKLYDAIRASIGIPTVFKPFKYGSDYFVDGGLLNPVPVNRVARHEGDLLFVSDVNGLPGFSKTEEEVKAEQEDNSTIARYWEKVQEKIANLVPTRDTDDLGIFNLTNKSIGLMLHKIAQLTLEKYPIDLLIQFNRDMYGTYDFHKAKELIQIGREKTKHALELYESVTTSVKA